MEGLLSFLKLDVIVGLSTLVGVITQLIKMLPPEWTTDKPKTVAWIVSAVVVGGIGYYEGADISVMAAVTITVALVSHGLYDVLAELWYKFQ